MKVAIFTELFVPHIGGQELRYAELARSLVEHGHSVDVYCVRDPDSSAAVGHMYGARVFRYPKAKNYTQPRLKCVRRRVLPLLKYSWWCRRVALDSHYDLYIYNQWPLAHVLLSPLQVRQKALIDWCEVRTGLLFRVIQSVLPIIPAHNIAVSETVARNISYASGRPVEPVPSGVNTGTYRNLPLSSRRGIIYLGRLKEHKNVSLLLSAFRLIVKSGFPGQLVIAGDGPDRDNLKALAEAGGLTERVEFPGVISEQAKLELLSTALVFVLPSRREGFPRVIAEAMASGLPVVTVDYPENGAKDIVRQYRCGVVTGSTARDLARGISNVIHSWHRYSCAGLSGSKGLDWSSIAERLVILGGNTEEIKPL